MAQVYYSNAGGQPQLFPNQPVYQFQQQPPPPLQQYQYQTTNPVTVAPRSILKKPYTNGNHTYQVLNQPLLQQQPAQLIQQQPTLQQQPVYKRLVPQTNSQPFLKTTPNGTLQWHNQPAPVPAPQPAPTQTNVVSYVYQYPYTNAPKPVSSYPSQYVAANPNHRQVVTINQQQQPTFQGSVIQNQKNPLDDQYILLNPRGGQLHNGNIVNSNFVKYKLVPVRETQQPTKKSSQQPVIDTHYENNNDDEIIYSAEAEKEKRRRLLRKQGSLYKKIPDQGFNNHTNSNNWMGRNVKKSSEMIRVVDDYEDSDDEEDIKKSESREAEDDPKRDRYSAARPNQYHWHQNRDNDAISHIRKPIRFNQVDDEDSFRLPISPLRFRTPPHEHPFVAPPLQHERPPSRVEFSNNLTMKSQSFNSWDRKQPSKSCFQPDGENHRQDWPSNYSNLKSSSFRQLSSSDYLNKQAAKRNDSFESLWVNRADGYGIVPALPSATKLTKKYSSARRRKNA
jgi:hypothetical protein